MTDLLRMEADAEARIDSCRKGDFQIRLHDAKGVPIRDAQVSARLVQHDFRLGANGFLIAKNHPDAAAKAREAELLLAYEKAFAGILNYATLPFYWGGYEPVAGEENGGRLRAMATWCRDHGIRTKGHPLAWHEVFPKWAEDLADTDVLDRLRARIRRITREFRGLVDTWDVFNEITVAPGFDNAVGRWVKERGGLDCVLETLALARAENPEAELLYNDFNISPAFEELVTGLQAREASFDAIGIQSHMHVGAWSAEKLWETCETYARFGLPLHFTEMTILSGRLKDSTDKDWHKRHADWPSTPEGEARQFAEGRELYTLLFSHPAVEAVTWWDFSDRQSWQGAPAGLLRNDMSLKPLAQWLHDAFGTHWTTRAEVHTDAVGEACWRGFDGVYALRATLANGVSLAGTCSLSKRSPHQVTVQLD